MMPTTAKAETGEVLGHDPELGPRDSRLGMCAVSAGHTEFPFCVSSVGWAVICCIPSPGSAQRAFGG